MTIKIGDRVRLNNKTHPVALRGAEGLVVNTNPKTIRVLFDKGMSSGKFRGVTAKVPVTYLDVTVAF